MLLALLAGCGGGNGATSVARWYEEAILSRDGDSLCATFAPKLREVVEEQIANEQSATGGRRFGCGSFYRLLIGFSHENTDRRFVSGKLLAVSSPSRLTRQGVVYVKVRARLGFEFTYTGYSTRRGEKGSAPVGDVVWLSRGKTGGGAS